ncbi:MAG: pseudouridine synthase [Magnetococcales bacterium]|nr:pseudouridine synthase [Magnetococcales bacterium]
MADPGLRLQKWLAEAGLCSRREGERWIEAGRVSVNGEVVSGQGSRVMPGDRVAVDGRVVQRAVSRYRVLLLNKPTGYLCTRRDPEGRPTIFDLFPKGTGRLISVGRLDYNSEGLLLLTNDGRLAHGLMHPSREVERVYRVRVHGRVDDEMLARLQQGAQLEDGPTGPVQVVLDQVPGANSWLTITLKEGRNRMVRRFFEAFEMEVNRLIRISYGGVTLGELERGRWRETNRDEMKRLMEAAQAAPKAKPQIDGDSLAKVGGGLGDDGTSPGDSTSDPGKLSAGGSRGRGDSVKRPYQGRSNTPKPAYQGRSNTPYPSGDETKKPDEGAVGMKPPKRDGESSGRKPFRSGGDSKPARSDGGSGYSKSSRSDGESSGRKPFRSGGDSKPARSDGGSGDRKPFRSGGDSKPARSDGGGGYSKSSRSDGGSGDRKPFRSGGDLKPARSDGGGGYSKSSRSDGGSGDRKSFRSGGDSKPARGGGSGSKFKSGGGSKFKEGGQKSKGGGSKFKGGSGSKSPRHRGKGGKPSGQ